jgi:hypothetical protein
MGCARAQFGHSRCPTEQSRNPRRRPSTLSRSLAYAFAMSINVHGEQVAGALGAISSERVANPKAPLGKLANPFTSSPSTS